MIEKELTQTNMSKLEIWTEIYTTALSQLINSEEKALVDPQTVETFISQAVDTANRGLKAWDRNKTDRSKFPL